MSGLGINTSTSSAIPVNPNIANQIQLLLPGETAVPGSSTGKTGTPNSVAAGDFYFSTVNLTDAYFNVVPQATQPKVVVQTIDPTAFATAGAAQTLALNGSANFGIVFQHANNSPDGSLQAADAAMQLRLASFAIFIGARDRAVDDDRSATVEDLTRSDRSARLHRGRHARFGGSPIAPQPLASIIL